MIGTFIYMYILLISLVSIQFFLCEIIGVNNELKILYCSNSLSSIGFSYILINNIQKFAFSTFKVFVFIKIFNSSFFMSFIIV